jgi:hypothetical protein
MRSLPIPASIASIAFLALTACGSQNGSDDAEQTVSALSPEEAPIDSPMKCASKDSYDGKVFYHLCAELIGVENRTPNEIASVYFQVKSEAKWCGQVDFITPTHVYSSAPFCTEDNVTNGNFHGGYIDFGGVFRLTSDITYQVWGFPNSKSVSTKDFGPVDFTNQY